jgi:starvation-inducible outer membrane lipoprotein
VGRLKVKGLEAAAVLAIAIVLTGCSSVAPDLDSANPGPDQVTTVTSGKVLPAGKPNAVEGRVGVEGGCVVITETETDTSRLAVWPVGTQLAESQPNVMKLTNGEMSIGELIEPSSGYVMTSDEIESLLLVEGNSLSGWDECRAVADEAVVLSYVKDFAQQE